MPCTGYERCSFQAGRPSSAPTGSKQLSFLLVFDAIMFPFAIAVFGRSLEAGRRLGVLAGY